VVKNQESSRNQEMLQKEQDRGDNDMAEPVREEEDDEQPPSQHSRKKTYSLLLLDEEEQSLANMLPSLPLPNAAALPEVMF
jgi:hypothetical protein